MTETVWSPSREGESRRRRQRFARTRVLLPLGEGGPKGRMRVDLLPSPAASRHPLPKGEGPCPYRLLQALTILLLFALAPFLHADTLTGEVRGGVFDIESRNTLPDATMTLLNVDRGWRKQAMTEPDGNYVFLQLEPGNYSVTAEKLGYYSSQRTDILIRLNQPKVVIPPFELRRLVSTPTQQITVQGEQSRIAIVDLTTPGPNPAVLAYLQEPGRTSMATTADWSLR